MSTHKEEVGKFKLKVIRESDDSASRIRIGDIVEVWISSQNDIVNIGGGHYKVEELFNYFEIVEPKDKSNV